MCKSEELSVSQTGHTGIRVATEMNSPYKQLTRKRHSLTKEAQRRAAGHDAPTLTLWQQHAQAAS